MKNVIIILIICIAFINNTPAQSFIKENKIWSVAKYLEDQINPNTVCYKFEGDTLINSRYYKKTLISGSLDGNYRLQSPMLREENNITYVITHVNHNETILYDFNLKAGDLFYWYGNPEDPFVVDSVIIRTILGIDRKHWYLSRGVVWIEGLGSLNSPLEPFGIFLGGGGYTLLCVHDEGIQIYQNPDFSSCDATSSYIPLNGNNKQLIELFSSGEGIIKLQLKSDNKGEISIFRIDGKKVLSQKVNNDEAEICGPYNGLFLYRYINDKGEVQTGKINVK